MNCYKLPMAPALSPPEELLNSLSYFSLIPAYTVIEYEIHRQVTST